MNATNGTDGKPKQRGLSQVTPTQAVELQAVELLESAIAYLESVGIKVTKINREQGLAILVHGVHQHEVDGQQQLTLRRYTASVAATAMPQRGTVPQEPAQ